MDAITTPDTVEDGNNETTEGENRETIALHREDGTPAIQESEPPNGQDPPNMHTAGDQQLEADASEKSPPNEGSPSGESGETTEKQLSTDLTRKPPLKLDKMSLTQKLEPSNGNRAPTYPLIRDQRTEKKTNEHPTEKIETNEESTGPTVVLASSHLDSRPRQQRETDGFLIPI